MNEFIDKEAKQLINLIRLEFVNQEKKFSNQEHTIEKWFTILSEEIGEIAKDINKLNEFDFSGKCNELLEHDKTWINYRHEIIQSITLLVRIYYMKTWTDFKKITQY